MGLGDKLAALLSERHIKPATLADETGISRNTIYSIIKRNSNKVDMSSLNAIADYLDISLDYFFDAASPDAVSFSPEEHDLVRIYRTLDDRGKSLIRTLASKESELIRKYKIETISSAKIDMIVYNFPAAAGLPIFAEDGYERIEFSASEIPKGADFGIRIIGDSMEPTIPDHSIVFVRKTTSLKNRDIAIFMINDDESLCKRFIKHGKIIELHSDNPAHAPIIVKEHQNLTIVGKVLNYR